MRIRQLEFASIYPFDTFQLDFGSSGPALHILYGPNEAGKSTLRQLLLDLLFGGKIDEPLRARYDSRSRMEGILESQSDLPFHIRRKKRNTKLLLTDGTQTELSEELLIPYLGGYDKERFGLLFGFDHVRLRQGGESLLQSGGHAGVSLFEAGGGIQYLQGLLSELSDRATNLLDPRFTKNSAKMLNKALRAYSEAENAIRANSLRGEDWQQLVDEISELQKKLECIGDEKLQKTKELLKLQRTMRVHRHVERYNELSLQRANMGDIPVLTSALDEQVKSSIQTYESTVRELTKQEEIYQIHKQELDNISLDEKVLQFDSEIKRLGERLSLYIGLKDEDIPLIKQRMTGRQEEARRILQEITPDVTIGDVERLRIPFAVEEETTCLSEELKKVRLEVSGAHTRYKELSGDVLSIENDLSQIGTIPDMTKVRQVVKEIREAGDLEEIIRKKEIEIEQKTEALYLVKKSQQLWSGNTDELLAIPVPLRETLDRYQDMFAKMQKEIEECKRDLARTRTDRNHVRDQIETLELSGHVPIEAELKEARGHRDTGWILIKQIWLNHLEEPKRIQEYCGKSLSLADAFEAAKEKADQIADWMRKESDRSAKRAHMLLQQEQLERTIGHLENHLKELENQFETLCVKWQNEWLQCGFIPKFPAEMKEWLVNFYHPIIDGLNGIQGLQRECNELIRRKDRYSEVTLQLLTEMNVLPDGVTLKLRQLVALCEEKVAEVDEKLQQQFSLRERLKVARRKLTEYEGTVKDAENLLLKLETAWGEVRARYPFLPENPDIAVRYIHKLREVFQLIDDIASMQREMIAKETICRTFEDKANQLLQDMGEDEQKFILPIAFVRQIQERLAIAKEESARKKEKQKIVLQLDEEIERIRAGVNRCQTDLTAFQAEYGCSSVDELRAVIEKSEAYKRVQLLMEQVQGDLREAGDGFEVERLAAEVDEVDDFDELSPKIDALKESIHTLELDAGDMQKRLWERKQEYDKLDGSQAEAAAYAQDAEHHLAEVDPLWNEYLRVELARRLLGRTIDQFRRKNESSILGFSSEFFAKLTLRHYTSLSVEYEDNEPYLQAVTDTGEKRRVSQMSDGTRDQLFLAMRLAFLKQHLWNSEPLPLIMDDILVHFDDKRTEATLEILHEFASQTQILYFTHHQSVLEAVNRLPDTSRIRVHHLEHQYV
jgi:uncharacterized protein YhaN